jgi:hypothetical protein
VDIGEKVLERLATSDKTTIVIGRRPDGKMQVTSGAWDGEKIFSRDQVLEVRHAVPGSRLPALAKYQRRRMTGTHRCRSTIRMALACRATSSLMTDVTPSQPTDGGTIYHDRGFG